MAPPKKTYVVSALAITFLARRYAPQMLVFSSSLIRTTLLWLSVQLLLHFVWTTIIYPLCFSPLRKLPQPSGAHPILGHFVKIFKETAGEPQREWAETVPNDGVIYYRWLFNEPRVLITSAKALEEVLVRRSYEFIKPERIRAGLGRLLGVGILLAEGDEHRRQRKALMPAFGFRHVKDLYPIFWSKSRELVDTMSKSIQTSPTKSSVVDIREWASRATLDIIGIAGMGQDFSAVADPTSELMVTYNSVFNPGRGARFLQLASIILPGWLLQALPIRRNEEFKEAIRTIRRVASDLIQSKRAKLEKGGRSDVDILSVAIESGGFSDEDLVNQLMTFLAAGHETTASAMTWATLLLCQHPEVQTRLRSEVHANLPDIRDPSSQITSTAIDHLSYLRAVLNEVSRVYPPVPLTLRETVEDTTIQSQFVPAGTTVVICPWATNRITDLWGPTAVDFDPDRWLDPDNPKASMGGADNHFAVSTFLHGPRSCIGKDFAKAEFACLMAALVGRFSFELEDPDLVIEIQGGITAKPKGGLKVVMKEVPWGA